MKVFLAAQVEPVTPTRRALPPTSTRWGYDIVADFGGQLGDLLGGHADKTFKMPNPDYYLP